MCIFFISNDFIVWYGLCCRLWTKWVQLSLYSFLAVSSIHYQTCTYLPTVLAREVMQLPLSVYLSIQMFVRWTKWLLTVTFCMCMGRDHSSPGFEGQSQSSKVEVEGWNVVGWTSVLNREQFSSVKLFSEYCNLIVLNFHRPIIMAASPEMLNKDGDCASRVKR